MVRTESDWTVGGSQHNSARRIFAEQCKYELHALQLGQAADIASVRHAVHWQLLSSNIRDSSEPAAETVHSSHGNAAAGGGCAALLSGQ